MIPFAIINFAGGVAPVEKGLKAIAKNGRTYFALGHNGDLFVMGGSQGNGLGKTGDVVNKSTGGWTLTNTGVDEVYGNLESGGMIRKGSDFYMTGWFNGFPSPPTETQNDWRLVDPAYYTVDGYNVFGNIVTFYPKFMLCKNGNIYTTSGATLALVAGVPAGGVKWVHVSNDTENKVIILNNGQVMAQGYNGKGKAIDATSTDVVSWLGTRWEQVKDCAAGSTYEEVYTLQSRRRNGQGTIMDRYNLILGKKKDGTWWVSGTQGTGLGNSSMGTNAAANVMAASTIPNNSRVIPGEAYGYNWADKDRTWYVTHQIFVENENLGVHQSTGDQGTCFTLANSTTYSLNCSVLTDVALNIKNDGGIAQIFNHATEDRVRTTFILTKGGKLFLTGQGVDDNTTYPPGVPQLPTGNDTHQGYVVSGPFPMPDFG